MSHDYWYEHDEESFLRAEKTLEKLRERRQAEAERVENALMDALAPVGTQAGLSQGQFQSLVRLIIAVAPAVKKVLDGTNLGYLPYWARVEADTTDSKED